MPAAPRSLRMSRRPRLKRLVVLTLVLLLLWFSGPSPSALDDARARRRLADPRVNSRSPGGWYTGLAAPARARRSIGAINQRVAARRRPGRRG
jgi:hypothetical protein